MERKEPAVSIHDRITGLVETVQVQPCGKGQAEVEFEQLSGCSILS